MSLGALAGMIVAPTVVSLYRWNERRKSCDNLGRIIDSTEGILFQNEALDNTLSNLQGGYEYC